MGAHSDMEAFDRLPSAIRKRLATGKRNMSAEAAYSWLINGRSEQEVLAEIDRVEARIIEDFNAGQRNG